MQDCVRALARLGLDVRDIPVTSMPADSPSVGLYWVDERRIEIRADLAGCALFRVVLHEYGHALGLEHKHRGIMGPCRKTKADFAQTEPTPRQVKMWTSELARLVLENREKQWRA